MSEELFVGIMVGFLITAVSFGLAMWVHNIFEAIVDFFKRGEK